MRWAVVAAVATCWAVALAMTGSVVSGTVLLLFAAALGTACVLALRAMGVGAPIRGCRGYAAARGATARTSCSWACATCPTCS